MNMNSLLHFLPIGNYKCINTYPVESGVCTIEYINDAGVDGLLFSFYGENVNKTPTSNRIKYLSDGTIHNENVQTGKWHVEDDQLILVTSSVKHPSRKRIIERVGNVITNVAINRTNNEHESTEVFIGGDSDSNYASVKNIAIIGLLLLSFILYNKNKKK